VNGLTLVGAGAVFNAGTVNFPSGTIGAPIPQIAFTGP
jgi:hypothetical protein